MMPLIPKDLMAVLLLTFLTLLSVFAPQLNSTPLRVVFGLPFVLFLPGYALIAALFPRKGDLDGIERVALSFGLSIAVVPLIGLILNYTPFGIRLVPIAMALSIFTVVLTFIALYRRNNLSLEERFKVSLGIREKLRFESESGLDRALSILLVVSIAAAVFALIYVIATPKQGERFTEFYILGSGGLAADYPLDLVEGRSSEVRVGVVNQEYESLDYNLEVVLDNHLLLSQPISLAHNRTWEEDVTFVPDRMGEDLKLEFLLYKNASSVAYRSLHLWVDVN
jgi:uncharacterized membrane protein